METETKESDSRMLGLGEEEDLEVVSEVVKTQQASSSVVHNAGHQLPEHSHPLPAATVSTANSNESQKNTSTWSSLFGKRFGIKREGFGVDSSTTAQKRKDWSKDQETFSRFKESAVNTFTQMSNRMGEGGSYLYEASKRRAQATAENLKKIRIFKTPLESLCKAESTNSPCPRVMLICCTAIAANGLSCQDIFKLDPPEDVVIAVSDHILKSNGAELLPPGAKAEVLAAVIKRFLSELMEPLLTYRLCEDWISAGDDLGKLKLIVNQLPEVNKNVLGLLLDCLHRISANAAENNMHTDALAKALAPCLLWRAPKPNESSKKVFGTSGSISGMFSRTSSNEGKDLSMKDLSQDSPAASGDETETAKYVKKVELHEEELQKFSKLLSILIASYKAK
eukprot:g825.t1